MKFALAAAFISAVVSAVQAHPEPAAVASLQVSPVVEYSYLILY